VCVCACVNVFAMCMCVLCDCVMCGALVELMGYARLLVGSRDA